MLSTLNKETKQNYSIVLYILYSSCDSLLMSVPNRQYMYILLFLDFSLQPTPTPAPLLKKVVNFERMINF